jgi:hypothetical protein
MPERGGVPFHQSGFSLKRLFIEWLLHLVHLINKPFDEKPL